MSWVCSSTSIPLVGAAERSRLTKSSAACWHHDAGNVRQHVGEISILPMPSHDRSLTGLIAFAGLGAINAFAPSVLEIVGEKLAAALTKARAPRICDGPRRNGHRPDGAGLRGRFLTGFMRGLSNAKEGEPSQDVDLRDRCGAERRDSSGNEGPVRGGLLRQARLRDRLVEGGVPRRAVASRLPRGRRARSICRSSELPKPRSNIASSPQSSEPPYSCISRRSI